MSEFDLRNGIKSLRRELAKRDERIGELEEENAELLSKLEQIIAPVEVGGGIEAVLRTRVKELEGELARPKHEVLRQLADAIERIGELEEQLHLPCVICGLAHSPGRYNGPEGSGWAECYERRRAERLDAEIVELRRAISGVAPTDPKRFEDLDLCVALNNHADLSALVPVVRAAAMQVEARDAWTALIDSAASAAYYDACEATEGAVRALPADLRERLMASERMGVDRG